MKKKKIRVLVIIALIIIAVIVIYRLFFTEEKKLVIRTHVIETSTVENNITATGTLEPVETVDVGTQVSGEIKFIYIDFNSTVTKGQLLAELDKKTLNEKVSQARASVTSSESALSYAQQNYNRTKQLYDVKAATTVALEEAQNSLVQAQTSLVNAKANLDQALVNLSYAEIYSPIDGIVLDREVEVGQTVAASFSTPTLFTIANDLTKMQVEADVDEADIGQVKINQKVTFTVDAYSDDIFIGTVNQIRLQPTTTSNVVTYTVIIDAPNPDEKLFPGMTASVTIITESQEGLVVPSEALSFTPSAEVLMKMDKPEKPETKAPQHEVRPDFENAQHVWVKNGNSITPRIIKTGMSDGVFRIVESGLNAGDSVVLSASLSVIETTSGNAASNPFMPTPPKRR